MSTDFDPAKLTPLVVPQQRGRAGGLVKILAAVILLAGGGWAFSSGIVSRRLFREAPKVVRFVEVDEGDIAYVATEYGSVESANNTVIRCQVEALVGAMGGTTGGQANTTGSGQGSTTSGSSGQTGSGSNSSSTSSTTKTSASQKTTSKTDTSSSTSSTSGSTSSSTSSSSSSSSSNSSSSGSMSSSSSGSSSSSSSSSSGASSATGASKPTIRSFSYVVTPFVPLRPDSASTGSTIAKKQGQSGGMMGSGGGGAGGRGGSGRGGRGGGSMLTDEKPGSTRIVEIVPEGTRVKKGDIVCKLDSSTYEDEERVQQSRYESAKAYVKQAEQILGVNEITLEEYDKGIYPNDLDLIRQYIETCKLNLDRAKRTMDWSHDMLKKGFRAPYQVVADDLTYEQARIALDEAEGMRRRLVEQTGPKIKKALLANVKAALADKLTQDAALSLETQRLARLRRNIANCTLRAPRDGIVIYANQTNPWGMITQRIEQGVTLHQDQPVINLPDPQQMRVKVSINEAKVSRIYPGLEATIAIDAYPDVTLHGRVTEVIPISTPLRGSDVHIYYANVEILDEVDLLKPGLSAEITFNVQSKHRALRVPLECVRWINERPYVAVHTPGADDTVWSWKEIDVGISDDIYAEVTSGLDRGDRVAIAPAELPAPEPTKNSPNPHPRPSTTSTSNDNP